MISRTPLSWPSSSFPPPCPCLCTKSLTYWYYSHWTIWLTKFPSPPLLLFILKILPLLASSYLGIFQPFLREQSYSLSHSITPFSLTICSITIYFLNRYLIDSSASPVSRSWSFLMASGLCFSVAQNSSLALFATSSLMALLIFSSFMTLSSH